MSQPLGELAAASLLVLLRVIHGAPSTQAGRWHCGEQYEAAAWDGELVTRKSWSNATWLSVLRGRLAG